MGYLQKLLRKQPGVQRDETVVFPPPKGEPVDPNAPPLGWSVELYDHAKSIGLGYGATIDMWRKALTRLSMRVDEIDARLAKVEGLAKSTRKAAQQASGAAIDALGEVNRLSKKVGEIDRSVMVRSPHIIEKLDHELGQRARQWDAVDARLAALEARTGPSVGRPVSDSHQHETPASGPLARKEGV